jgi:hypothetical protein
MKKSSSSNSPTASKVASKEASRIRSPSPSNVAKKRSPSPSNVAKKRNPSPSNVAKKRIPSPSNVAKKRNPSPSNVAKKRSPSPSNVAKKENKVLIPKDAYKTPFWPPSNYSVPAKVTINGPNPLPRTLAKHNAFIKELKNVLINEKIIDRDNPKFQGLLDEQQKWNHIFYKLKPYNIICFVKCDYHLYDKSAPRVFHKNNEEPFFGNFKFKNLLKKNNMSMKWYGNNILYIHKNRF